MNKVKPMKTVVFVLKKAPGGVLYDNYNNYDNYGPGHYDPSWSILRGCETCKHIRFTGYIGKMGWMEVMCLDLTTELRGLHMLWKVSNDCQEIRCFIGKLRHTPTAHTQMNDNINVIRLRMYWVLRIIVCLKRLLSRCRMRKIKRKLFIKSTYWNRPDCAFSCFSGTINTPVKKRVHAFI